MHVCFCFSSEAMAMRARICFVCLQPFYFCWREQRMRLVISAVIKCCCQHFYLLYCSFCVVILWRYAFTRGYSGCTSISTLYVRILCVLFVDLQNGSRFCLLLSANIKKELVRRGQKNRYYLVVIFTHLMLKKISINLVL